jgi:hypothetical protein
VNMTGVSELTVHLKAKDQDRRIKHGEVPVRSSPPRRSASLLQFHYQISISTLQQDRSRKLVFFSYFSRVARNTDV